MAESRLVRFLTWPFRRLGGLVRVGFTAHPILMGLVLTALVIFAFAERPVFEPAVLFLRVRLFIVLFALPITYAAYRFFRAGLERRILGKAVYTLVSVSILVLTWVVGLPLHDYVSLWWRFQTLSKEELSELPITGHERIQPLNAVASMAHEVMTDTNRAPTIPNFVRDPDGSYRFTFVVQPDMFWYRWEGGVKTMYSIPGEVSTISFGSEHRSSVNFDVGESLLFSQNSHSCVVRAFGPFRFLSYDAASPIYLRDDAGKAVEVVPLIRYKGIFFPVPEFGGVQVLEQNPGSFVRYLERFFLGCGTFVPPEEIGKHRFLSGQNLVPLQVARYNAESFRFTNGLMAPLPGFHYGDLRIPDLPGDMNDLPFVAYFETKPGQGKLYDYFGLEPYNLGKEGLSLSIFHPSDGQGPLQYYNHDKRDEVLIGVSAIAAKVMSTRKSYDWTVNRPVENRPIIRDVDGKRRFYWMTTVVTFKDAKGERFVAGSNPEVAVTEADSSNPVVAWVDPTMDPNWAAHIEVLASMVPK